jgi:hypothetical protein
MRSGAAIAGWIVGSWLVIRGDVGPGSWVRVVAWEGFARTSRARAISRESEGIVVAPDLGQISRVRGVIAGLNAASKRARA